MCLTFCWKLVLFKGRSVFKRHLPFSCDVIKWRQMFNLFFYCFMTQYGIGTSSKKTLFFLKANLHVTFFTICSYTYNFTVALFLSDQWFLTLVCFTAHFFCVNKYLEVTPSYYLSLHRCQNNTFAAPLELPAAFKSTTAPHMRTTDLNLK